MRISLMDRSDFVVVADLRPIVAPAGYYSLRVSTIWRNAKDPSAEQVKLDATLDRDALLALRGLFDHAVSQ